MHIKGLKLNRKLLISILIIFAIGFLSGYFATAEYQTISLDITKNNNGSKVKIFLLNFTQQYWIFFLMWFSGLIPLGFIFSYFIDFFKAFILGISCGFIMKAEALFGTYSFFKLVLWQVLIIIPLIIYLSYYAIQISFDKTFGKQYHQKQISFSNYLNSFIYVTIAIVIYSLLVTIFNISVV